MEKAHWLGRKRASLKMAQSAQSAEARLVHYDLAGRYSLRAASSGTGATDLASSAPRPIVADNTPAIRDDLRAPADAGKGNKLEQNSRAPMDECRGSPKDANDAIDDMIRRNIKLHGA